MRQRDFTFCDADSDVLGGCQLTAHACCGVNLIMLRIQKSPSGKVVSGKLFDKGVMHISHCIMHEHCAFLRQRNSMNWPRVSL